MKLEVGPEADREMNHATLFYEEKAAGLGREFLDEVRRVFGQLRETPEAGTPMGKAMRRFLLRRFPFSVLYRIRQDTVVVVAIMHASGQATGKTGLDSPLAFMAPGPRGALGPPHSGRSLRAAPAHA